MLVMRYSIEELFYIAYENAMAIIVVEDDKQFLHFQRQERKVYMRRIDKELLAREQRKEESN